MSAMKTDLPKNGRTRARVNMWLLLPNHVRRLVMWAAGMPCERADDDLTAFSAIERSKIRSALRLMMQELWIAEDLMNDSDITTRTIPVLRDTPAIH